MSDIGQIVEKLKQLVDEDRLCGYNIAILDGEDTYYNHYGYAIKGSRPVMAQRNTLYDLASLSKVIATTTCILKLIDEGLLNLDDRISGYIDIYEKDITVAQCLSHTTGFEADLANYKVMNDSEFIRELLNFRSIEVYKGLVHYSDINFIYLGFVIKKLKGSLEGYAFNEVFKPLRMNDTCYNPLQIQRCAATEVSDKRGVIQGRVHDGKAYRLGGVSGSAGVFSCIEDVVKYVRALMDFNNPFFSEKSREILQNPLADTKTGRRCAGWILSDPNCEAMGNHFSECTLYHTGFTGGSVYADIINRKALIVLCNRIYPNRNNDSIIAIRKELHNCLYTKD